jgi:hypothetical protein
MVIAGGSYDDVMSYLIGGGPTGRIFRPKVDAMTSPAA